MRAWLLLLAVLATSKPIVQVASTEDLTTRFSTAISTRSVTSLTASYEPVFEEQPLVSSSRTVVLYDSDKSESDSNKSTDSDENSLIVIHKSEETQGPVNEEFRPEEQTIELSSTDSNQLESLEQEQKTNRLFDKLENNNYSEHVITKREASSESSEKSSSKLSDQTANDLESFESESLEAASSSKASSFSGVSESAAAIEEEEEEEQQNSVMAFDLNEDTSDMEAPSPSLPSSSLDSSHIQHSSDKRTTSHSNSATDDVTVSEVMQEEGEGEEEHDTYSNKEVIGDKLKPDPSTLVEIENSLLSLFNMKRPPKIDRSKIIIPEAMKQLYAQIMGHEIDSVNIPKPGLLTKSANTVRSFTHQESKIDDRFLNHHRFRLHFDVKSIPTDEKLKAAEVQLSRDAISHAVLHPRLANRTRYQVLVYDITRVGIRGKREPTYLLLDNKTIRLNSTDTISLDVQPAVDRWLETPKKNYGLLIEVRTFRALKPAPHHHVRLRRSADEPHEQWQHKQPLLFTYTDDGRHKSRSIRDINSRPKRAGHHRRPHRRKNNVEICRRQSLYVDFTDVGWSDWIVAPPGYDAYYCHGKCPFPLAEHLNSTNHAVVQTLVNNLNPGKVPNACCVPTQLTGISMLYLNDQSTVVLKNYQDMTVVGCGCR